jgi:hypothetical protein
MKLPPLILLAAMSLGAGGGPASAVRDNAGLFSPEAVQKADEEIAALQDVYHLGVEMETITSPAEELRTKIGRMKPAQAAPLLKAWAEKEASQAAGKGVYILICKEPGDVEVIVPPEIRARDFTLYDATRLRSLLQAMRSGPTHVAQRDKRLLEAVGQLREAVRYNLRPPFPWFAVSGVLAGVLGLWGVLSLVRRRLYAVDAPDPLRLNLFNASLGSRFGTAAAHWIVDALFVAASRSCAPPEQESFPLPAPAAPPAVDETAPGTRPDPLDLVVRDELAEELNRVAPTRF